MSDLESMLLLCMSLICLAIGMGGKWVENEGRKSAITTEEA